MSPSSLDPHNRREYLRRAAGVELLGGLCLLAGAVGLLNPGPLDASPLASELDRVARAVWLALYAGGGALSLAGLYWPRLPRPELEGLGLWLLIGGFSINLLGIIALYGPVPNGATLTTVAALLLCIRLAYRRLLDLERASRVDRRALDLGPRARRRHAGTGEPGETRQADG